MKRLEQYLHKCIRISTIEKTNFLSKCVLKSFEKKEVLHPSGQYINEVFFVEEGMIRIKIIDLSGKEHTTHFAIENQFIADYNAFLTKTKSQYILEALEPTKVVSLSRDTIKWGYTHLVDGEKLGRLIAEYYFVYLDTRIQHMYTLAPIERYELMGEIFPNIHNRVPQHMIASYLGITPIHLSRIKSKR